MIFFRDRPVSVLVNFSVQIFVFIFKIYLIGSIRAARIPAVFFTFKKYAFRHGKPPFMFNIHKVSACVKSDIFINPLPVKTGWDEVEVNSIPFVNIYFDTFFIPVSPQNKISFQPFLVNILSCKIIFSIGTSPLFVVIKVPATKQ